MMDRIANGDDGSPPSKAVAAAVGDAATPKCTGLQCIFSRGPFQFLTPVAGGRKSPSSNSSGGSGEIYHSRMKVNDRVIVKPTSKSVPIGSRMEIKDTPGSTFKNMPDLDNEGGSYADEIEKEEKELRIMDFGA